MDQREQLMTTLTKEQGRKLLVYARAVLAKSLGEEVEVPSLTGEEFTSLRGTFVTLKKNGQLRGCIGNIEPVRTMAEGVEANVLNAAFNDSRFPPLGAAELEDVDISVSILSPALPLVYEGAADLLGILRVGVDGVILRYGNNQATFLPQVWEQLQDAEEFLAHLSLKAGLARDGWKNEGIEIFTYQVENFAEESR